MVLLLLFSITSHDFSHMVVPVITSEIGFQAGNIISEYAGIDGCNRYALSMLTGAITTYVAFRITAVQEHYISSDEWQLADNGFKLWCTGRFAIGLLHIPLWKKEKAKPVAYMETVLKSELYLRPNEYIQYDADSIRIDTLWEYDPIKGIEYRIYEPKKR